MLTQQTTHKWNVAYQRRLKFFWFFGIPPKFSYYYFYLLYWDYIWGREERLACLKFSSCTCFLFFSFKMVIQRWRKVFHINSTVYILLQHTYVIMNLLLVFILWDNTVFSLKFRKTFFFCSHPLKKILFSCTWTA